MHCGLSRWNLRTLTAKALAVSLYQPEGVTNRFFVEAPQKIFAHLLSYLPTPEDLINWMSDPAEIDRRVKGTEYWMLIDPKAPQQRTGVLGSLNMSADSFRLLPKEDETTSVWTATKWAETRRGWIFITSRPTMREALRPLTLTWPPLYVFNSTSAHGRSFLAALRTASSLTLPVSLPHSSERCEWPELWYRPRKIVQTDKFRSQTRHYWRSRRGWLLQ